MRIRPVAFKLSCIVDSDGFAVPSAAETVSGLGHDVRALPLASCTPTPALRRSRPAAMPRRPRAEGNLSRGSKVVILAARAQISQCHRAVIVAANLDLALVEQGACEVRQLRSHCLALQRTGSCYSADSDHDAAPPETPRPIPNTPSRSSIVGCRPIAISAMSMSVGCTSWPHRSSRVRDDKGSSEAVTM